MINGLILGASLLRKKKDPLRKGFEILRDVRLLRIN